MATSNTRNENQSKPSSEKKFDALAILKEEHRKIVGLLDEYKAESTTDKSTAFRRICDEY